MNILIKIMNLIHNIIMEGDIILWSLIIITIIISIQGWNDYNFFQRYKFKIFHIIKNKQYDRLVTASFLHVNWSHLLFNMITLYFFSKNLIHEFSIKIFFIIYFGSILIGSLTALFINKKNKEYHAVGSSGGVSGIIYSSIALSPHIELFIFPLPIPIPGWIFAIIYMYYSLFGMRYQWGNISHSSHLGGALFGLITAIFFKPEILSIYGLYIMFILLPIIYILFLNIRKT